MREKGLGEWTGKKVRVYDTKTNEVHAVGVLTNVTSTTMRIRQDKQHYKQPGRGVEQGVVFPRYDRYTIELVP
jgi:hypothetical protein